MMEDKTRREGILEERLIPAGEEKDDGRCEGKGEGRGDTGLGDDSCDS